MPGRACSGPAGQPVCPVCVSTQLLHTLYQITRCNPFQSVSEARPRQGGGGCLLMVTSPALGGINFCMLISSKERVMQIAISVSSPSNSRGEKPKYCQTMELQQALPRQNIANI